MVTDILQERIWMPGMLITQNVSSKGQKTYLVAQRNNSDWAM